MFDTCTIQAVDEKQMRKSGHSLACSLYSRSDSTIVLRGELGAGKTTFVQGFAEGLGVLEHITSPTYALEQRYGDNVLSHIDLYRLTPVQAAEFMRTLDPFPGIRVIEWSDRTSGITADLYKYENGEFGVYEP
jgi:tRNA threonylcarbamoyladenosine biosynthesis protein TsaE